MLDWIALAPLLALLALLTVIDLRRQVLPNRLVIPGAAAAALAAPLLPGGGYGTALLGATVAFLAFLALYLARPGVIGGGDVKLAALIGFALGFPNALLALLLAPVLLLVVATPQLALGRWTLQQRVPYGPYLAAATVLLAVAMTLSA